MSYAHFKTMHTEIEEVKQEIKKVQQQIDAVEVALKKVNTQDDIAFWRKKEEQLRDEEERLREKELFLLKADTPVLSSGVPEKLLQELTEFMAKIKAKLKSKKSVCLSSVSQSIWGTLERQEGLKMIFKNVGFKSKRLSGLPAFGWDDNRESSQADRYIVHLNKITSGRKWKLIDTTNKHPTLLSVFFGGWNFKGTTNVAFVHRIVSKTEARRGLKCIFELKKDLRGDRDKAVIQTVIRLVMANVFSQQFKPCTVLTDLIDSWSLYWMDGSTIYWCTFESRASAVGYIEELLQDSNDNELGTSEALASHARPQGENEDLQFTKKRRMYEPP